MIPKTITILGQKWSIQQYPLQIERPDEQGYCDANNGKVFYRMAESGDVNRDTILHEIMHGIENLMDLELEEREVRLMATGLLDVLRDPANAAFWAWMMEVDNG